MTWTGDAAIEALLTLPIVFGSLSFVVLVSAAGLLVWIATFRLHARLEAPEAVKAMEGATGNLLRVVGWLFTLLLSLTFTSVVAERKTAENAVEGEAKSILDVHHGLRRLDLPDTRIQTLLVEYTRAVVEDEWPALEQKRLSERADEVLRQMEDGVLGIEATSSRQKTVLPRVIADLDVMSDQRMSRLVQAREEPTLVILVVFFGYLASMAYFGIYAPRPILVGLIALYTAFVGVSIYLVLAMGHPFLGPTAIDAAPLEYALETMSAAGQPAR